MRKIHIAVIIIIILIIFAIVGFFIFNNLEENDEWLNDSGDTIEEQMLFNDVPESYWASEYIDFLTQREIMNVNEDGNFYPEKNVSVGEFIKTLALASLSRGNFEKFSGDNVGDYSSYIEVLTEYKVLEKDEMLLKNLNDNISKKDVAILLAKVDIFIRGQEQKFSYIEYKDLKEIDEIGQTLISHATARGLVSSDDTKNFYPTMNLTRAEIAEIIYKFINS